MELSSTAKKLQSCWLSLADLCWGGGDENAGETLVEEVGDSSVGMENFDDCSVEMGKAGDCSVRAKKAGDSSLGDTSSVTSSASLWVSVGSLSVDACCSRDTKLTPPSALSTCCSVVPLLRLERGG